MYEPFNNSEWIYLLSFYFIICSLVDNFLVFFSGHNARWFKLHACYNFFIVGLTFDDIYSIILNPSTGFEYKDMRIAFAVFILHFYHCIFFKLKPIDYYHHGLSVFFPAVIVPNICYRFTSIYYFNLCGLPGGIDYLNLVFVKEGYMTKITQKQYSSNLNAYIRIPLGIICCCYNYIGMKNTIDTKIYNSLAIMSFIIYINVVYFGKLAIENHSESKMLQIKQD